MWNSHAMPMCLLYIKECSHVLISAFYFPQIFLISWSCFMCPQRIRPTDVDFTVPCLLIREAGYHGTCRVIQKSDITGIPLPVCWYNSPFLPYLMATGWDKRRAVSPSVKHVSYVQGMREWNPRARFVTMIVPTYSVFYFYGCANLSLVEKSINRMHLKWSSLL
jgi:hypothetical protein